MSIQAELSELKGIQHEIKNKTADLKRLRNRKNELEKHIAAYIKAKDLPGVKHHGTAVLLEEKTAKAPKAKKDREKDAIEVLEQYGIQKSPDRILKEILKARQGEDITVEKIKMKKVKNKD